MNRNVKRALGKMYTAYIVRDSNSRRFLNRKVYSGRVKGVWGALGDAEIFYDAKTAGSCAGNINHRRPDNFSAFYAEVLPVKLRGRGKALA